MRAASFSTTAVLTDQLVDGDGSFENPDCSKEFLRCDDEHGQEISWFEVSLVECGDVPAATGNGSFENHVVARVPQAWPPEAAQSCERSCTIKKAWIP